MTAMMWGSGLLWLILNIGLVAGVWWWWTQWGAPDRPDDPFAILRIRQNRGEISVREYEQIRALLEDGQEGPHERSR